MHPQMLQFLSLQLAQHSCGSKFVGISRVLVSSPNFCSIVNMKNVLWTNHNLRCLIGNTIPPTLFGLDPQRQCETEVYNSRQNHHLLAQLLWPNGISWGNVAQLHFAAFCTLQLDCLLKLGSIIVTVDWDSNDEHYSWRSCGPSICDLSQRAGYEPVHEDSTWALPQGIHTRFSRCTFFANRDIRRGNINKWFGLSWLLMCVISI